MRAGPTPRRHSAPPPPASAERARRALARHLRISGGGDRLEELSRRRAVRSVAYGHAGDGNLHVNFLWDEPAEAPRVQAAIAELFELTIALGGTLSGEHGVGVLKAPYLPLEQSAELIDLQRGLKQTFDPGGLLNPGKIFPPGSG
jgi:glycolate oxidase